MNAHEWITWTNASLMWTAVLSLAIAMFVFGTRTLVRFPLLLMLAGVIIVELAAYVLLRWIVTLSEACMRVDETKKSLQESMLESADYGEWQRLSRLLDEAENRQAWKTRPESRYYQYAEVKAHFDLLTAAMRAIEQLPVAPSSEIEVALRHLGHAVHSSISKDMWGIYNESLYSNSHDGTKVLIEEFVDLLCRAVKKLASTSKMLSIRDRPLGAPKSAVVSSFVVTSHASDTNRHSEAGVPENAIQLCSQVCISMKRTLGVTALCLSGGASLGNYHVGVVRALLDEQLLPKIISGTSAGAVVAGIVCTRTDSELRDVLRESLHHRLDSFQDETVTARLARFWREGSLYSNSRWLEKLRWHANDLTFLEAFNRTGRVLNITATSQRKHAPPVLLNYLTAPHVTIASAILASSAVPLLVQPVVLQERMKDGTLRPFRGRTAQYRDGSMEADIPMNKLAEMFGVSFFIVSQVNPHVVPFFFNNRGQSGSPSRWRRRTGSWRGGFLLSFLELMLKEDMRKNLRILAQLDMLPSVFGSDWSYLFLQEFQGHVTLVPSTDLLDFWHLLSDPTVQRMRKYIQGGKATAWRKMPMLRSRMLLDQALDEALRSLAISAA